MPWKKVANAVENQSQKKSQKQRMKKAVARKAVEKKQSKKHKESSRKRKEKLTHSYGCNRLADSASSPGVTQVPARNEPRPLPPSEEPHTAPSLVV